MIAISHKAYSIGLKKMFSTAQNTEQLNTEGDEDNAIISKRYAPLWELNKKDQRKQTKFRDQTI